MTGIRNKTGTTLIELMVAIGVFAILIGLLYPSFSFMNRQISTINDKQLLSERGARVINYLAEEIRMIGFLTGSTPNITYCGTANTNAVSNTNGNPYDTLTFLTSVPIVPTATDEPFFELTADAAMGSNSITLNVMPADVSSKYIDIGSIAAHNAKALITFDTLSPTILQRVYQIGSYAGSTYTAGLTNVGGIPNTGNLVQQLVTGSRVYAVKRKMIDVNTDSGARNLRIVGWNKNCTQTGITENVYSSLGTGNEYGGVDGLQFEYTLNVNGVVSNVDTIIDNDLRNLTAVTIWVLLRAGFPTRGFDNVSTYTLGTVGTPITVGPFGDEYRRVVLTKTVEVKNLVF